MSAMDDFMKPRVRIKRLTFTVSEARIVERALRDFGAHPLGREGSKRDKEAKVARDLADRLKLAKLERGLARKVYFSVEKP